MTPHPIENPVLHEEFLSLHNAEILSGPHDLTTCLNLSGMGGNLTLASPRLLKTKSRNFLIHVKTIHDVLSSGAAATNTTAAATGSSQSSTGSSSSASGSSSGTARKGVSNRRKGILRYLFPSVNKLSSSQLSQSLAAASSAAAEAAVTTTIAAAASAMGAAISAVEGSGLPSTLHPSAPIVYFENGPQTAAAQPYLLYGLGSTARQRQLAPDRTAANMADGGGSQAANLSGSWDWVNEVHVTVRAFKSLPPAVRLPNERHQRIAMCESSHLLHELLVLASTPVNAQQKHLALDILLWLVIVRMGRFRSPKKTSATASCGAAGGTAEAGFAKSPSAGGGGMDCATEMAYQQRSCVQTVQHHLVDLLLNCFLYGNRSTASKCVKVLLVLTE